MSTPPKGVGGTVLGTRRAPPPPDPAWQSGAARSGGPDRRGGGPARPGDPGRHGGGERWEDEPPRRRRASSPLSVPQSATKACFDFQKGRCPRGPHCRWETCLLLVKVLGTKRANPSSLALLHCCGSGVFIQDPGSWFLSIPDPGSKNSNKEGENKFVVLPFFVA